MSMMYKKKMLNPGCCRSASARLRIRDNENGTYTVAYTPEIGGDYYISVKHSGIDIQGSPFTVSSDPMPREGYLEMYRSVYADVC